MNSSGGWQPFRDEDKPLVPGQDSHKIFSKEGLITAGVVAVLLIVGGILFSMLFGPYV